MHAWRRGANAPAAAQVGSRPPRPHLPPSFVFAARLTGRRPRNPDAGSHRTRSRADQFPVLVAKTADAAVGAGGVAVRNANTIAAEGAQVDRSGDSAAYATDRASRKDGVARRRQRMFHSRIRLRDQARAL